MGGGGAADDGAPRRRPMPAAGAPVPARWRHGVAEGSLVSFDGDQGRCGAAWAGVERCTGRSSAMAAAMAAGGELWEAGTMAHTWLAQGP
jgi:hypothetical protein